MGACAYPTRKSGDKQAKSVRCTYNANFTGQGIEGALSLLTRSSERGSACG